VDYIMRVEDCWRPPEVQEGLLLRRIIQIAFENPDWRPEKVQTVATSLTAPRPGLAGHQAGAAIDWTLRNFSYRRPFEPNLGNEYAEGGAISSLDFPYLTFQQWKTRTLFEQSMRLGGFKLLRTEDWHGSYLDRGMGIDGIPMEKALYGPLQSFDVVSGTVEAYKPEDTEKDYISIEEVRHLVLTTYALKMRLKKKTSIEVLRTILPIFRQHFRQVQKK
jgi:hypothetical protein